MSAHVVFIRPVRNECLTKFCRELNDLSYRCNHPILNEILMADNGFSNTFGKVLRSSIFGNYIVRKKSTVIFKTEFCGVKILRRCSDVMQQACEIVDLSISQLWGPGDNLRSIFPFRKMVFDNCFTWPLGCYGANHTEKVYPYAMIICFLVQFFLDIFVHCPDNFGVRDCDFVDWDIRAIFPMAFQKLFLTPWERIESVFSGHILSSKFMETDGRRTLKADAPGNTRGMTLREIIGWEWGFVIKNLNDYFRCDKDCNSSEIEAQLRNHLMNFVTNIGGL